MKKDLFKKIIGKYTVEQIKSMTIKIIRTRPYNSFPKISEMIEAIEGNPEAEIEMAWIYLVDTVEREGYYASVCFPRYPAIGRVIQILGGWPHFCETLTYKEQKWIKKDFEKLYPAAKRSGNIPERLPGFFELENAKKGYDQESIKALGMTMEGKRAGRKLIPE